MYEIANVLRYNTLKIVISLIHLTLREKCPNTEFDLVRIFLYSIRIQENTRTRKNSVFGHFSRSVSLDEKRCTFYVNYFIIIFLCILSDLSIVKINSVHNNNSFTLKIQSRQQVPRNSQFLDCQIRTFIRQKFLSLR